MTQPLASTTASTRILEGSAALTLERGATVLLSAVAFLLALTGQVLEAVHEPLLFSGDFAYRNLANVGATLLCAVAVPAYAWALRRSSRAAVSLTLSVLVVGCAAATAGLGYIAIGAGTMCRLTMAAGTFTAMHLWAVACDVDRATALRRLPWMAVATSLGVVTAGALDDAILRHLGVRAATLLVAGLSVVHGLALMGHERRDVQLALVARVDSPPPPVGVIGAFRSRLVWILACLSLVLAFGRDSMAELHLFPDTPRWPGPTILLAGTVAMLVLAVPFLRRVQAPLVAVWPVAAIIGAVAVLVGASTGALAAVDVLLAAASPVSAVAREALLVNVPREQRFVGRAALWFWAWPIGRIAVALPAVLALWWGSAPMAVAAIVAAIFAGALTLIVGRAREQG